jgi:glycosyltransferase involved in cell wall biosynthesis
MRALSHPPLVSVIVPFFNAQEFLEEALESVFAQTFDDWELLLIDDGSSDGSSAIAERYAREHGERVRLLRHSGGVNRGMSASRNLGIDHARGAHIAFLDADDIWLPQKLERQVALSRQHPSAAMIYGPLTRWYSWTGEPEDAERDCVIHLGVAPDQLHHPPAVLLAFLRNDNCVPSNGLLGRDAVLRVGRYEERFRGVPEDQVFNAKLCFKEPVYACSESWVLYRQHGNSSCSTTFTAGQYDTAKRFFFEWLEEYLRLQRCTDADVWRSFEGQLWCLRHPVLYRLTSGVKHRLLGGLRGYDATRKQSAAGHPKVRGDRSTAQQKVK